MDSFNDFVKNNISSERELANTASVAFWKIRNGAKTGTFHFFFRNSSNKVDVKIATSYTERTTVTCKHKNGSVHKWSMITGWPSQDSQVADPDEMAKKFAKEIISWLEGKIY